MNLQNPNSVPLTADTAWLVDHLFAPQDRTDAAAALVIHCARNLPSCEKLDSVRLERIRFAVLKNSCGDLKRLRRQVREAQIDWRDVLMAAGFGGDVNAHRAWLAKLRSRP